MISVAFISDVCLTVEDDETKYTFEKGREWQFLYSCQFSCYKIFTPEGHYYIEPFVFDRYFDVRDVLEINGEDSVKL